MVESGALTLADVEKLVRSNAKNWKQSACKVATERLGQVRTKKTDYCSSEKIRDMKAVDTPKQAQSNPLQAVVGPTTHARPQRLRDKNRAATLRVLDTLLVEEKQKAQAVLCRAASVKVPIAEKAV